MTRHESGRPPGRNPENRPSSHFTAATPPPQGQAICTVTDAGRFVADEACPACGHDGVSALHDLIAERRQAWLEGRLDGFGDGWDHGLEAGLERGAA